MPSNHRDNNHNWGDKVIWTGDNLDIMRGMNDSCVDLIYLDPPFNSNKNYEAPTCCAASGVTFRDIWTIKDTKLVWHALLKERNPGLYSLLEATKEIYNSSMMSYLIYMAIRLVEMHRILKQTGSIYLHCDPTASHYLKLVMDCIFGRKNFRNEIVWRRNSANNAGNQYGRNHDILLYYVSSKLSTWNGSFADDYSLEQKSRFKTDEDGNLYKAENLTAPRSNGSGDRVFVWRGAKPGSNRQWAYKKEKLEKMWDSGIIITKKDGKTPRLDGRKVFIKPEDRPKNQSIWTDISRIPNKSDERTSYPTQKPLQLLYRIIEASSNAGDIVLDPFCGCATTCIAAEKLGRRWAGIDISSRSVNMLKLRMNKELERLPEIDRRVDIPCRTDQGKIPPYNSPKNKDMLYGKQGGYCAGCEEHLQKRFFEIDHIVPRVKRGSNHISNLQLLCGTCNRIKGDREQEYLIERLIESGIVPRRRSVKDEKTGHLDRSQVDIPMEQINQLQREIIKLKKQQKQR